VSDKGHAATSRGNDRLRRMLEAPIPTTLAALAGPNIAVATAQSLSTIADAWFVGMLGVTPLAALALVFPVQALINMMSAGAMGGGVSSAIARALGAGNRGHAEAVVVHAALIALAMAAVYTLLFAILARPVFHAFGGRDAVLDATVAYAEILFGGAAMIWLANTLASVLRGTGNMIVPAAAMVATALLSIVLSGALTLGWFGLPAFGVRGPAIATIIGFFLAAAFMAFYLASGRAGLRLRILGVPLRGALFYDIVKVGGVACGNALLTVATIVIVTALVGVYGTEALAGYGLGSRLELMLIPIAFGVGGAMTAMVGANRGAKNYGRARRIAWTGGLAVFAFTGLIGIVVALFPDLWIGLFTADAAAAEVARRYLWLVGPFYAFFGLGQSLYFASQGTGDMSWPITAGALRIVAAAGLGAVATVWLGASLTWLFVCVALGLVVFGGLIAYSLTRGVWNPETVPAPARAAAE